ncbi:unnamed protein product [Paramecium primaurelia]|uniref:Uncharacterized protein n=1 Tax=Paramecium primaurelia TaxID=5886 RepID=A0A8S1N9R7_PARPR|nr:unnamed protein product [Paramecium primaurelia]
MPPVLSKILDVKQFMLKSTKRKVISGAIIAVILYLLKIRLTKSKTENMKVKRDEKKGKGNVDRMFLKRIFKLIKIVIPRLNSPEILDLILLTASLVARTFLSIYVANVNGQIVRAIIEQNLNMFLQRILKLGVVAIPASFVNSFLDYLNKSLAIRFRKRLTSHFHDIYLNDMIFYQLSNLDSRVANPDQRLTADIEKWANSLSQIYSNFSKPVLDIILFSRKLAELVGYQGPMYVILYYLISGFLLRFLSPPFGKLTAIEQRLEGDYRACHSDLVYHSEEIAFYRGHAWEKTRITNSFNNLIGHTGQIILKRLYMGVFDSMLVKYGAVMVGYAVVGLPVFGSRREEYLKSVNNDASAITRDYVRNSSLLINLAKAIGRLVVSYKEIQQLAGYTTLVAELDEVLKDLINGKYMRTMLQSNENQPGYFAQKQSLVSMNRGQIVETENTIKFEEVPIISPNNDILAQKMTFEIQPNMNCIVTGPNGCGKSSLFRILGGLWPISSGKLYRPHIDKLFYIPQRPYLPAGTLRDQIIYPHTKLQMLRKKVTDDDLTELLRLVHLDYLVVREGGYDKCNDWNDVLSGGEKQRIAMARLFYHKPVFAILDECTSAVSMDVEATLYQTAKMLGITLFTVSHRPSLFKHHDYMIQFDGEQGWNFKKIEHSSE